MLTARQLLILNKIIEHYTVNGEPVSSKTLVEAGAVDASSATIRNEMSILEDQGYIQKVHSSSGRIPSVKGYRYYVDKLMRPKNAQEDERSRVRSKLNSQIYQMSDVFYRSAELLSELTNYTAFVLGPHSNFSTLTGFKIVPLNQRQMMLLLQLDSYSVQNMVFKVPEGLQTEHVEQVTQFMNKHFVGESLTTVYYALKNDLPKMFERYLSVNWDVTQMLENTLFRSKSEQMFVSGKMNLLDFIEDMETDQVKDLYNLLDSEGDLMSLFQSLSNQSNHIDIRIGNELNHQLFEPFSLITVPYTDEHFGGGIIAVLGPTNMTYDSTLGRIQLLRDEILDRLEDFYLD